MAARLGAAALAGLGVVELLGLLARGLLGPVHVGVPDALLCAGGGLGVLVLLGTSRATDRSPGAVDNGTGVVAVLATVDALPPEAGVGGIFPDAAGSGLVGSRAPVRQRAHPLAHTKAINSDGVADPGPPHAPVHRPGAATRPAAAAPWG